jgi:hypothetical protein
LDCWWRYSRLSCTSCRWRKVWPDEADCRPSNSGLKMMGPGQ